MNNLKQFHEKPKRGRPRNPVVERINAFYPEKATRRTAWNRYYMVQGMKHLIAVLGEQAREGWKAGTEKLPLPSTVLHALGVIPEGPFARRLTRECLRRRKRGERAHTLASWVRWQHQLAALRFVK